MGSAEVTFLTVRKCGAVVILPICRFYSSAKDGYLLNGLRVSAATESCVLIPGNDFGDLLFFSSLFNKTAVMEIYM